MFRCRLSLVWDQANFQNFERFHVAFTFYCHENLKTTTERLIIPVGLKILQASFIVHGNYHEENVLGREVLKVKIEKIPNYQFTLMSECWDGTN